MRAFTHLLTTRSILVTGGIMITIPLIPLRKRPIFQSLFGIIFGVSSIISPLVGGAFTDNGYVAHAPSHGRDLEYDW
jgi:MFS family permease